jgi:hypothetical protein
VPEPAVGGLGQAEQQRGDAGRQQGEPGDVQPRPGVRLVALEEPRGQHEPGHAERDVDPEHPPPAQVGEDQAAEERAEDRPEHGGQRDERGHPAEQPAARRAHDQRRHHRHHQPAAEALQDPRGDQRRSVPGQGGGHRPGEEDEQGEQPEPLAAEPGRRPRAQRHGDAEGEQVGGGDPLHGGDRGVQVGRQGVQRHPDDGGVEDDGEPSADQDTRRP